MQKNLLSALVASACALGSVGAQAALTFDLTGTGGPTIQVNAFDWAPTSFLALGGNLAIRNFAINQATGSNLNTTFDVLTSAKLTAYIDQNGVSTSLPAAAGEITLVGRFTETVTGFATIAGNPFATFDTTGPGWVQMFYSSTANSSNLTGFGFNDGKLIMTAVGVSGTSGPGPATGSFLVTNNTPTVLDGAGANDYAGQNSVTGTGSQTSIKFGTTSIALDGNFFKTQLADFSVLFSNISIGLPYSSVDPADCFNPTQQGTIGGAAVLSQCQNNHTNGTYAANFTANGNDGGVVPVVGATNGINVPGFNDFVAQTDYNSPVTGTTPEPGTLALLGLAFAAMGLASKRRRAA